MAELKLPELNNVMIVGNLTRDPVFRKTTNNTPVVNFSIASNRRYRDSSNKWQEEVCFVGVVAWNKLAESCMNRLKKGSAVFVEGELQSRTLKNGENNVRHIVEIKARRIQFLNKKGKTTEIETLNGSAFDQEDKLEVPEDDTFDKFLTNEESQLLKDNKNE
ncbi:MAG: Single-stranded DNA-binding protein [Ignavibacteriae bacterium]|nr:MAG: Single-stranded DNA-binding protein [Ignavibacteriota bacterium]